MQGKVSHVVQTQHGALLNTDRDFLHPWLFSLISLSLSFSLSLFPSLSLFLSLPLPPLPLSVSLSLSLSPSVSLSLCSVPHLWPDSNTGAPLRLATLISVCWMCRVECVLDV